MNQQQGDGAVVRGRLPAAGVVRRGRRAGRVGHGRAAPRDAGLARGRPVPAVPRALHLERARHDGEEAAGPAPAPLPLVRRGRVRRVLAAPPAAARHGLRVPAARVRRLLRHAAPRAVSARSLFTYIEGDIRNADSTIELYLPIFSKNPIYSPNNKNTVIFAICCTGLP